jgi:ketosteroid isomerase-like protein
MFGNNVEFEIPGDRDALPRIARKMKGRGAIADFVRGLRGLTEPLRFNVHDLLMSENRAVIVGELATKIKATGKLFESPFAVILTISDGQISRYQMLEDSFALSRAAEG